MKFLSLSELGYGSPILEKGGAVIIVPTEIGGTRREGRYRRRRRPRILKKLCHENRNLSKFKQS